MTATLADVLAGVAGVHWWRERGMGYGSPDRCNCGTETHPKPGDDDVSERRARAFAAHLAAEQSRAVAEWLQSEDVRDVASAGVLARREELDQAGVDDPHSDDLAAAALDAVAGLCGGEES